MEKRVDEVSAPITERTLIDEVYPLFITLDFWNKYSEPVINVKLKVIYMWSVCLQFYTSVREFYTKEQ